MRFRHYRGGLYVILHHAVEATNARAGRGTIVYMSVTTGMIYTRDHSEWSQLINRDTGSPCTFVDPRRLMRFEMICGVPLGAKTCTRRLNHIGQCDAEGAGDWA